MRDAMYVCMYVREKKVERLKEDSNQ